MILVVRQNTSTYDTSFDFVSHSININSLLGLVFRAYKIKNVVASKITQYSIFQ